MNYSWLILPDYANRLALAAASGGFLKLVWHEKNSYFS